MSRKFTLAVILAPVLVVSVVLVLFTRISIKVRPAEKIGAYYYIWWGIDINNHWENDDVKGTPFLGYYNSSNSTVSDQHILFAKQHRINFFAVSWVGEGTWHVKGDFGIIDQNLRSGLLEAPHLKDFNFCLLYETVLVLDNALKEDQNFTEIFIHDMLYAQGYFTNPSYLRLNDEPVLFIYNIPYLYQKLTVQDVHWLLHYVRQQLARNGVHLYIIGDMGGGPSPDDANSDLLYSMNATTSYRFSDPNKGWDGILEDAERCYPQWLSTMNSKGIGFVPNAYPGFNNTKNKGVNPPWAILPRNETRLRDMLEIALNHTDTNLGIAIITSWNEWMEGTMIEPSMQEGELCLHAVYDVVPGFP